MAYASTITMIPLARVAEILQIDPWHFHSVTTLARPLVPSCPDDWYQHDWQASGLLSRESMALALRQAEDMVTTYLRWSPIPRWYEEEHPIPRYYRTERSSLLNARGQAKSVVSNYGFVVEAGQRANTFIDTPATVFSDPDGDGVNELVTVTFATTVTTEDELRLYYPSKNGRDEFEIRPLTSITIAAGVATITFPKYLIALENLLERPRDPNNPHIGVDGEDDTNFLTTVDVYRVYSDPATQATFYYEDDLNCSSGDCVPDTETGCLFIRDARVGKLAYKRAEYNATTGLYSASSFTREPDKIKVYYRAGNRDLRMLFPNLQMDSTLERMIVYFALCFLDTKLHGCSNTVNIWNEMTKDLATSTRDQMRTLSWSLTECPFGTKQAAVSLWKYIQPIRLAKVPLGG